MSAVAREEAGAAVDAVVVGAGFAGLYMIHRLRASGLSVRAFEAGDDVGGTWYWNRYPGARCDVESLEYCYQFDEALQQEWSWSERYSPQPEILDYLRHVAERLDLRRDITFGTRVEAAHFDEAADRWTLTTDGGETVSARHVVFATGCLSVPNEPQIPGRDDFAGPVYHTGRWPHEGVDFTGRRVAVIGTGSSAIQSIPEIARQASEVVVFQRTPNHSVPARNAPLDRDLEARIKAAYADFRARNALEGAGFGARHPINPGSALEATEEEFELLMEHFWRLGGLLMVRAAADLNLDKAANDRVSDFVRRKIAEKVDDPDTAAKLMPDTPFGCKRPCADSGYFETFNEDHVRLIDVNETPIETITERGIRTSAEDLVFDDLVLATGFDAMTGALARVDIRGRDGVRLADAWAEGPKTYLGLQVAGFPNLFTITGPGSPSVLTNMIPSIEQHVRFVGDAIDHLEGRGLSTMEPTPEAQAQWVEHVNAVPGKPRVFMPYVGFPDYCAICEDVVAKGYEGFALANG
jgi:cyclohexanone monooxygenase